MTATEEELREALRLLEQRAPLAAPGVSRDGRQRRVRGRSVLRLVAVAATVLAVGVGSALIGLHRDTQPAHRGRPTAPAIAPAKPPSSAAAAPAGLHVRVALFGGPAKPGGHGGVLNNSPDPGIVVTVTGVPGGRGAYGSQLKITSRTDRLGVASFTLPPGRYRYSSAACGTGFGRHRPVAVVAGRTASAHIRCAVP